MKSGITIAVDGVPTDLNDASWYLVAPCGCTSGVTVAYSDYGPGPALIRASAEQAWGEFHESKAESDKYERLGFRIEVGLRADVTKRMTGCPHDPKYGYSIPKPEGMVWAVGGYHGKRTRVLHLVPEDVAANNDNRPGGYTPADSVCGQRQSHWSREWHVTSGKVECSRCVRKASAS